MPSSLLLLYWLVSFVPSEELPLYFTCSSFVFLLELIGKLPGIITARIIRIRLVRLIPGSKDTKARVGLYSARGNRLFLLFKGIHPYLNRHGPAANRPTPTNENGHQRAVSTMSW
ncbi:hypothetical protein ACFL27_16630, partial [candidate division CSSED10-310 bacterium]